MLSLCIWTSNKRLHTFRDEIPIFHISSKKILSQNPWNWIIVTFSSADPTHTYTSSSATKTQHDHLHEMRLSHWNYYFWIPNNITIPYILSLKHNAIVPTTARPRRLRIRKIYYKLNINIFMVSEEVSRNGKRFAIAIIYYYLIIIRFIII